MAGLQRADLAAAVQAFAARERRYGGILKAAPRTRSAMAISGLHPRRHTGLRPGDPMMIRDLAPLLGRRLSFGVVPDWDGEWPLTAHPTTAG